MTEDRPVAKDQVYCIQVQGELDPSWADWFGGMHISAEGGTTTLTGTFPDQAALRGVLTRLWDLHVTVTSVRRAD